MGGFITLMGVGAVQGTFGNILPYLASYMASKDENSAENYDYYTDQATWIYVARAIFFVFGSVFGAKLAKLFGGRVAIMIGDIILSLCVGACYFITYSLEGMVFVYGATAAVGSGIAYIIPLSIAAKWFPEHQALASGIILSGYGVAGIVFSLVFTALINPNNIELDPETGFLNQDDVLNNVPSAFWKMALICSGMQLFSMLFINEAPDNRGETTLLHTPGVEPEQNQNGDVNAAQIDMACIKLKRRSIENEKSNLLDPVTYTSSSQRRIYGDTNNGCCGVIHKYLEKWDLLVFKQAIFLNLWFTLFFSQMTNVIFSTIWKTFTNQQLGITSDVVLSSMGSISAFANAIGRIFWGYVNDKKSYVFTLGIMTFCDFALLSTWPFLADILSDELTLIIFANVWLSGIFFFQIGIYNIMVRKISEIYGIDKISYYYALLMLNQIPSGIFSAVAITEMRQTLGWTNLLFVTASFQWIAFCIVMSSKCCL